MPSGIYKNRKNTGSNLGNFLKGGISNPNFGVSRSKEVKRKLSIAHKGKKLSEKTKAKIRLARSKQIITEAHKKNISLSNMGRIVSVKTRKKISQANKGKIRSEESKRRISITTKIAMGRPEIRERMSIAMRGKRVGSKNSAWLGGVSSWNSRLRNTVKYLDWRTFIFERDNYICQECGQIGGALHADHVIPFSVFVGILIDKYGCGDNIYYKAMKFTDMWDTNNGRTLCVPCHKETDTYMSKAKKYQYVTT